MAAYDPSYWPQTNRSQMDVQTKRDVEDDRRLIECLRYLIHTRPDLAYSVRVVSRYINAPKESHLKVVKQILLYVKGTLQLGLVYQQGGDGKLIGYSNSSHGMDLDDGKGTTKQCSTSTIARSVGHHKNNIWLHYPLVKPSLWRLRW
nr:hypothetical protein [Tanacetum cinerariifolium]GEY30061.1 hypothetical protein [Tanacetum cinerariifolium]